MMRTLGQMAERKAALWVNAFFYYFKRLWLIGRWAPDSVYSNYRLKKGLSVLALVIRQIIDFCGKPLYLAAAVVLPFFFLAGKRPELAGRETAFMAQALFFLNCVTGAFGDSQIFSVTRDKVTCVKYLHMNARDYIKSFLAFKYIPFFFYYLVWLLIFVRMIGGTLLQGFFIWLMLFSFRMAGEAFQLLFFDRTGKVISRNMFYEWALIITGMAGAYLPAGLGWGCPLAGILLHPAAAVLYAVTGGVCLWFITAGYRGYERKYPRSLDLGFLFSSLLKSSSGAAAAFKEVEIREKDAAVSQAEQKKFKKLKGYAYLNALFFARHKRQLVKPVYYRLLTAALLFAGSAALLAVNREAAVGLSKNLTAILPFFIYIMYFMTVADKACRAMFYNCDKDLLHYADYRRPQTILKNFKIRLVRVCLYDAVIAGAVCLAAAGFRLLCGGGIVSADLFLFCAAILLLSVLFSAHHLCLYYIFQPYSESLQVKNPFYSVINVGIYVVCFLCLQIETGGVPFTLAVLGFTAAYIMVALALVYRCAPKSFRIK